MSDDTAVSVYQYYDKNGRILYVGITARGIRRAHEHAETKEWWPYCTGCSIEHFATRTAALLREEQLIKRYTPPFNTVHNEHKHEARQQWEAAKSKPTSGPRAVTSAVLKQRRLEWEQMTPEQREVHRCIVCEQRPSSKRWPLCDSCIQERKRQKQKVSNQAVA